MGWEVPRWVLTALATLAVTTFTIGLALEARASSWLSHHPYLVNLLSSITGFSTGGLVAAILLRRLTRQAREKRWRTVSMFNTRQIFDSMEEIISIISHTYGLKRHHGREDYLGLRSANEDLQLKGRYLRRLRQEIEDPTNAGHYDYWRRIRLSEEGNRAVARLADAPRMRAWDGSDLSWSNPMEYLTTRLLPRLQTIIEEPQLALVSHQLEADAEVLRDKQKQEYQVRSPLSSETPPLTHARDVLNDVLESFLSDADIGRTNPNDELRRQKREEILGLGSRGYQLAIQGCEMELHAALGVLGSLDALAQYMQWEKLSSDLPVQLQEGYRQA